MKTSRILFFCAAWPLAALAGDEARLRDALRHYVSFDRSLRADFSRGEADLIERRSSKETTEDVVAQSGGSVVHEAQGKFGGAIRFTQTGPEQYFYGNAGILDYDGKSWSRTVSVWLRVSPDAEIPEGYCDPIMVTADDTKAGFIFLEWSPKVPRRFRYAILPREELWNPAGTSWEKIPAVERPMVELADAPFSKERWTHVVFTFARINEGKKAVGKLYVDGAWRGEIKGWNQIFHWDAGKVRLLIGRKYVGSMDDLAVFDRELTAAEISTLYELPGGVGALLRR